MSAVALTHEHMNLISRTIKFLNEHVTDGYHNGLDVQPCSATMNFVLDEHYFDFNYEGSEWVVVITPFSDDD